MPGLPEPAVPWPDVSRRGNKGVEVSRGGKSGALASRGGNNGEREVPRSSVPFSRRGNRGSRFSRGGNRGARGGVAGVPTEEAGSRRGKTGFCSGFTAKERNIPDVPEAAAPSSFSPGRFETIGSREGNRSFLSLPAPEFPSPLPEGEFPNRVLMPATPLPHGCDQWPRLQPPAPRGIHMT